MEDTRLITRTLNDVTTPVAPKTLADWERERERLLTRLRFASCAELLNKRAPLNARFLGETMYDGFTVEKVAFESLPGFFVTGNLFKPAGASLGGKYPVILNPHGHWAEGRVSSREVSSLPKRCANFALRGFVAFLYDMAGYVDSRQVSHKYFHTDDERVNVGRFALQTLNSLKSVDFACSLPYVDASRLGVTGASGGATQAFVLAALCPRVQAVAPVSMISSTMQGGCVCENAAFLRLDASNVDYASLIAPRQMLMCACDGDWTARSNEIEFPAIRRVYALYGAEDRLRTYYQHSGHVYDKRVRERVYAFFSEAFGVRDAFGAEVDVDVSEESMLIGPLERQPNFVLGDEQLSGRMRETIDENKPNWPEDMRAYAWREVFAESYRWKNARASWREWRRAPGCDTRAGEIEDEQTGAKTAIEMRKRPDAPDDAAVVLCVFGAGADEAVAIGERAVIPALFRQDEALSGETPPERRDAFFHCYNYSDDAKRVRELANLIEFFKPKRVEASGRGKLYAGAARELLAGIVGENALSLRLPGVELLTSRN